MAPSSVIDLCSDSEPEETVAKVAKTTLQGFEPRKVKATSKGPEAALVNGSTTNGTLARGRDDSLGAHEQGRETVTKSNPAHWRSQQRGAQHHSNGSWAAIPALANGHAHTSPAQQRSMSVVTNGYANLTQPQKLDPTGTTAPRQNIPSTLLSSDEAERSKRVQAHDDYRAKEVARASSSSVLNRLPKHISSAFPNGRSLERNVTPVRDPLQDHGQVTGINGFRATTVLVGSGIAILDSPENTTPSQQLLTWPFKRHPPSPEMVGIAVPPSKRIRMDGDAYVIDQQLQDKAKPRDSEVRQRQEHAALSSQQLQHDLESAASTPQRPRPWTEANVTALHAKVGGERATAPVPAQPLQTLARNAPRARYTDEDNALLARLKEIDKLSWAAITPYFPGRSKGSLEVHYFTKVKNKYIKPAQDVIRSLQPAVMPSETRAQRQKSVPASVNDNRYEAPARRSRGGGVAAVDGFVPWTSVGEHVFEDDAADEDERDDSAVENTRALARQDRAYPRSAAQILRQRELGNMGSRAWTARARGVTEELKNHAFQGYALRKYYGPTCGDVTCVSWAPDGKRFAAGSIAITDDRSMQYNSGRNLLLGDSIDGGLKELPEHHVQRPVVTDSSNVNALHSMRKSQDPRLFMTVAAVAFSPDGLSLYSAGSDKTVRRYAVRDNILVTEPRYTIEHVARVDLLDVSQHGLIATGCHSSTDGSVQVLSCNNRAYQHKLSLSLSRTDLQATLPIFPSALRWGTASHHKSFLLAGFSSDSIEEDRDTVGETALWNLETGQRVALSTVTRNVFDVAWNPSPSSASTAFCVASIPGTGKSVGGRRSVVQCYAPGQNRARQVVEFDCPACDINDVAYSPYDSNLIAAGATDGKVYVWDSRYASRDQKPLHVLAHGESINVLDHDRERELADTGVRFLSWSATGSRLYSGSSDGVVKVWNPYRSTSSALVEDVATFQAAVMSGSFAPDFRQLLIGEESGRLNLLALGHDTEEKAAGLSMAFKLCAAEVPHEEDSPLAAAKELLASKQIELRPMGNLPVRQAVQGAAYAGPYLQPSPTEWMRAQEVYQQALDAQHEVHLRSDNLDAEELSAEEGARKVNERVEQAQAALLELQDRCDAFAELEPAAVRMQRAFRNAQKRRMSQEAAADHCKLKCNYFAPLADQDGGVSDSQRSAQRIPGALRVLPMDRTDISELSCNELFELGLAGRCVHCSRKQNNARMVQHLSLMCRQRCNNIKTGLTGVCRACSAPVRNQEEKSSQLCERCGFACLRCARPVQQLDGAAPGEHSIYCNACDLAWDLGVLGYDLVRNGKGNEQALEQREMKPRESEDTELFFYHSRWQSNKRSL